MLQEVSKEKLLEMVAGIKDQEFLALGDPILDIFRETEYIGESREYPHAPVLRQIGLSIERPGAVCNLAANGLTLGGKPTVVGVMGKDESANTLSSLLETMNIPISGLVIDTTRPTSQKIRTSCSNHPEWYHEEKIEEIRPIDEKIETKILQFLINHLAPVITVSDYGRGSVPPSLMQKVVQLGKSGHRRILIDPRPTDHINWQKAYLGAFLVKPNVQEATWMTKIEVIDDETVVEAGREIAETLESNVLLTRDCQGMTLVRRHGPGIQVIKHFPAKSNIVSCAVGAGDTVLATVALCLAAGYDLLDAVELSTYTAALSIAKPHTSVVYAEELCYLLNGKSIEEIIRQAA